ncbi:MAG: MFS transporter [Armatimonadetes bacterium]|nr:MFS transporter [Armatimonadota bacterium]
MKKIPHLRWIIVALLTLMTIINYLDRNALAVAQTVIEDEFHLTNADYGHIVTFFLIAYGIMHPIMGRIIDRLGSRKGLTFAFIWWSVASMLHALSRGALSLKVFRFTLGLGEAANFPGAVKTVGEWFPAKERALATGIFNMGAGIGGALAMPVVGLIIYHAGWREAFIFTGLIGFLWLIPWLALSYTPERHPRITPEELAYIREGQPAAVKEVVGAPIAEGSWKEAIVRRDLWVLMFARFLADPAWLFFSFWIPKYFKDVYDFDVKKIAIFTWIPFVMSDFGSLFGGAVSSFFVRTTGNVVRARKLGMALSAALMPVAIVVVHTKDWRIALLCLSVAAFAHQSWSASLLTFPTDIFPKRIVASAYGLTGMAGVFGGVLSEAYVGGVIDKFGYFPVFTIVGLLHPTGALITWLAVRGKSSSEEVAQ